MSLTTIPNQPINLTDPVILVECPDIDPPMLIADGDPIVFQFLQERCEGAEQFLSEIDPSDWIDNPGWTIGTGFASLVVGNGGQYIEESLWTATLAEVYEVEITLSSVAGEGFFVQVGGTQVLVNTPGTTRFTISAAIATFTRVVAVGDTSAGTITSFKVYEANRDFTVAIVQAGVDFEVYSPIDDPEMFVYRGQHVTFNKFFNEGLGGCFYIELRDYCTGYPIEYCSRQFKVVECREGLVIRTCNDTDAMGFVAGFFQARLPASLMRPSWEYEVSEERLSNGVQNRHFIERQAVYQLGIEIVGAMLHQWLAALPMFDHLYIGDTEWSVDPDGYSPAYDAQTGNASALVTVRDPNSTLRRVRCEDIGAGCDPANDPICNTANADVAIVVYEGQLVLRVDVYSSLGFVVQSIEYSINGVDQAPILVNGVPGVYGAGDIVPGDVVRVVLVNAKDPLCNDARAAYIVQHPCEFLEFPEGCSRFSFTYTKESFNGLYIAIQGMAYPPPAGFFTVIDPDGGVYTLTSEDSFYTETGPDGPYCVFNSDGSGKPVAGSWTGAQLYGAGFADERTITNLNINNLSLVADTDPLIEEALISLANVVLVGELNLSIFPALNNIQLNDCDVPVLPNTSGLDLRVYAIIRSGISIAPDFTVFPNIYGLDFSFNVLPTSETSRIVNEASANFVPTLGTINLTGQTPLAPLDAPGLVSKAELEGRSPGWTVSTD
jgi:hypothetical protein